MTKFYIIDADNNLSVTTNEDAAILESQAGELKLKDGTTVATGVVFASQEKLASATEGWPASRLVEVWNSFAGAPPFGDLKEVKRFTDRKSAVARVWQAAQRLGTAVENEKSWKEALPARKGKAARKPTAAPTVAKGAPKEAKAAKGTKAKGGATEAKTPREGSKQAQVVAMLMRKNGATLAEIMDAMGWQRHTVRGFMAGAMKKAGYAVESFKPEGGERTYRINS